MIRVGEAWEAADGTRFELLEGGDTVLVGWDQGIWPVSDLVAFAEQAAWIPTSERLPAYGRWVLVYCGVLDYIAVARYRERPFDRDHDAFVGSGGGVYAPGAVTAWRELPAAPEEG